jgi:hypothetical protein
MPMPPYPAKWAANMTTARNSYIEKQKAALAQ